MDVLLSAAASDLIGRLFSFLIGKYQESSGATDTTTVRLQQALLRARVLVEEAEGRQIANRAMLLQLNQLRGELWRATYALDTIRWRARVTHPSSRGRRSHSHATAQRSRSHTGPPPSCGGDDCLESLEAALSNMREFVVLIGACPRVTRQPYSAYLFMERCMFGRQMEMEQVISFLLSQPSSSRDLDVLPIIGPHGVGKRTLVEHACLDERVRERFAVIHRLSSSDLHGHEHQWSSFDFTARSLTVIDIDDRDAGAEASWRRFHSSVRRRAKNRGCKIILISRTDAHSCLGSLPALRLHQPRREELWYLFRALAFGAADPDERPDLARLAMTICARISSSGEFALFEGANMAAASLRADLSTRSWRRLFKVFSEATMLPFCSAAGDGLDEDKAGRDYLCRPVKDAPDVPCLFYNRRVLLPGAARGDDLPKLTMSELLNGRSFPPAGKTRFDVLVLQSRIPPYASYVATCDTERARQVVAAGQKRARKRRQRD